jgi:hypothetical protein
MRNVLLHYSYDSIRASLKKVTQYAQLGAAKRAAAGQKGGVWRALASALSIFIRLYLLRGGFLSGGVGFVYCYIRSQECFFRYIALKYDREILTDTVARDF